MRVDVRQGHEPGTGQQAAHVLGVRVHRAGVPGRGDEQGGRERDVLTLVARGLSDGQIADELAVTETSVKSRVRRILRRLGLDNRVQAALLAHEAGLGDRPT